jgi:hypothetical protein
MSILLPVEHSSSSFRGMCGIAIQLRSSKIDLVEMEKLQFVSCGGATPLLLHYKFVCSSVDLPLVCSSTKW